MTEAAMALSLGGITFLLTVIWGGPLIRVLKMYGIGERIRIEGPQRHFTKLGTPTMGGIIIVVSTLIPTILWARLDNLYILFGIVVVSWLGLLGYID
ncbi:MAG: phospho-N-acetylmuramoyl-pentapeptide-transferase, partial [Anaerolineales bacterium]